MDASTLQLIILPAGIIAVLFAMYLARDVLARDTGTQAMQDVAGTIFEGAVAFIRRQYTTIAILAVVGSVVIGLVITIFETKDVADTDVFGIDLGWRTGVAFLVGAACSMASGIIGMYIIVKANVRTRPRPTQPVDAVQVAMRYGAASGFLVVACRCSACTSSSSPSMFGRPTRPRSLVGFGSRLSCPLRPARGRIYTRLRTSAGPRREVENGIPRKTPDRRVVADASATTWSTARPRSRPLVTRPRTSAP